MYENLYRKLRDGKSDWDNEAEVRQGWIYALQDSLKIQFHAERDRKDSSYNNVIIEFKDRGLFKGKTSSKDFKIAIYDRLLPYIIKASKKNDGVNQSDYIGIAIDAEHICFAQVQNDQIQHGHLLPLSGASVTMVAVALKDSYRRALSSTNLIEDFGHSSSCGINILNAFSKALTQSNQSLRTNKTNMLYEEWKTLFGQVANLSTEQRETISGTLNFVVDVNSTEGISTALFAIHTYNSLLIKLLGAEIISAYKLTSYQNFSQHLSTQDDDELHRVLNYEIERGRFYANAGINGFVEEALFSWYLDIHDEALKKQIFNSIRELLIRLSFYRTDNLTQAQSHDLLKLFYQNIVPETLRKSLGEFYTPDWLVNFTLEKLKNVDWLEKRVLDPTCGSGSFLIEVIKRKLKESKKKGLPCNEVLTHITSSTWGFDLNPLAVQAARVNYLIAIADLLKEVPGTQIEIPVLLADAIYSPSREHGSSNNIVKYKIGSAIADLEITIPYELSQDRNKLDCIFEILGNAIESDLSYKQVEKIFDTTNALNQLQIKLWNEPLENTYNKVLKLHKNNWNGIWFRIIRNFFWSATAGEFDIVVGNPPWVRWSKLPDLYRERVKSTCMQYNIFSSTPHHGGNELDISGMITYTVSDKWLKENGTLAFVLPQSHFQSPSSEGFRDFKINDIYNINPVSVDDFKNLKPFPDATNKTAVCIFKKVKSIPTDYPVEYIIWKANENFTRNIPVHLTLTEVKKRISSETFEATPVTGPNSPWAILSQGRFTAFNKLIGKSTWIQGRKGITADLNGVYFVDVLAQNLQNNLVQIRTRPEAGKTNFGPAQEFWVEQDLLFPLIKGASDFSKCHFHRHHSLYTFIPNNGIIKKAYDESITVLSELRKTKDYFSAFKIYLEQRSTFKGRMKNAPYYAIYNIGNYTFSPWKVVWAEQKDFCAAVVSSTESKFIMEKVYIPDHKIYFVDFQEPNPAYFLCGLLNSDAVIEFVKSHNISIQTGDIFKHMNLPKYSKEDRNHLKLVRLVKDCHQEINENLREKLIRQISNVAENIIEL